VRLKSTGKIYAMKVLHKTGMLEGKGMEHTMAEKAIMIRLSSPFIVKLHFTFQSSDKIYFVMDYVNGGTAPTIYIYLY
jgi:serine/threonine protein kinase